MNPFTSAAQAPVRLTSADAAQLSSYLQDEVAAQSHAFDRMTEKERLIVKQDVPGLQKFLTEAEPLLAQMEELTQRRLRIMALVGRRLGLAPDLVTMQTVIEHADDADRDELTTHTSRLRDVLQKVGRLNRRINVLIRHALDTNRALLHALFGDGSPRVRSYGAGGKPVDPVSVGPRFSREI